MSTSKFLKFFAAGSVALLVVGAAAACGGGGSGAATPTTGAAASSPAAGGSPAGNAAASTSIKVTTKDNLFDPKALTVPVGKSVEIDVKNEGQAVHNMHILSAAKEGKDFSSSATISPGAESKFTVTFTKPGTYNFQCDYHLPDMVGTITVQ